MDRTNRRIIAYRSIVPIAFILLLVLEWVPKAQAAPTLANITGEIERISLDNTSDHWSGGTIVVGGQIVILPRNLLLDLPANRLTLTQLFEQAPAACVTNGESGLAKADLCNQSGAGGFATISANRSDAGNVIAGDVLIEKGKENVTGAVTFINYTDGYFRVSGQPGVDNAGVIVRLNDPTGRHTVQQGLGCAAGNTANCSPDPRFTLDPDNYTNVFTTGFPLCLPSTVPRTVTTGLPTTPSGIPGVAAGTVANGAADGTGDVLCPSTNRGPAGVVPEPEVADSRRFAPIKVGDSVTAEGNFEVIDGVKFLSSHTTKVQRALQTKNDASQPDYLFLEEVFIDAPGFINQRARALFIGFTTLATPPAGTDVLFWTIHRDPINNAIHEFPLGSTIGCDLANGGLGSGSCTAQGLVGAGGNIFRIRYDVDFLLAAAGGKKGTAAPGFGGADSGLSPCAQIRADRNPATLTVRLPEFVNACPSATDPGAPVDSKTGLKDGTAHLRDEWSVMSPIPREIQARTGHRLANPGLVTLDVRGNTATNGQYLFPFGINLGGISVQEFVEVDLDRLNTPTEFAGIPWNFDRRLSPGGCNGPCETDAIDNTYKYRLDPFPFENLDPRTQADFLAGGLPGGLPTGSYTDNIYTASTLTNVRNRIFSYVSPALGKFDGDNTVIPFNFIPAGGVPGPFIPGIGGVTTLLTPPAFPIIETPSLQLLITVLPPPPVTGVTLTVSPTSPRIAGTQVLFLAAAAGGSGTYEYQFSQNVGGVLTVAQPYGPSPGWLWNTTGLAAATYNFQVDARSAGSVNASEASAVASYTILPTAATGVTITPAPASPQPPGASVAFVGAASGGSGTYEYQFSDNVTGAMAVTRAYSQASAWIWNTTGVANGTYSIKVDARYLGSTAASEATATTTFTLAPAPVASVAYATLTANPASPGPARTGDNVVLTAQAYGGSGTYEYRFWLMPEATGVFAIVQDYSSSPTWTWNTTGIAAGNYLIAVHSRNVGSTAFSEAGNTTPYSVNGVLSGLTLSANLSDPRPAGDNVVFTAAASGGTGSYEYRFWLYSGGTWSVVQAYSSNPTWTWNTAGVAPGSYLIAVHARNAGSTAFSELGTTTTFTLQ